MNYLPCVLALLLAPPLLTAQTTPPVRAAQTSPALAAAARIDQYFADLGQRLRDIYFAPSDARATALLSTATEEFGARRRALRQELGQLRPALSPAERQALAARLHNPDWPAIEQAILKSPAAAKMADRVRRNPALETAFQRFADAQLMVLEAPAPAPR